MHLCTPAAHYHFTPHTHTVQWYLKLTLQRARPSRLTVSFISKCTLNKYHWKRKKRKTFSSLSFQHSLVKLATGYFKFQTDYTVLPYCFVVLFSYSAMTIHHILSPKGRERVHLFINSCRRFLGQITSLLHKTHGA